MPENPLALDDLIEDVAVVVCKKPAGLPIQDCLRRGRKSLCQSEQFCKIAEKTMEQLGYVVQPLGENIFLSACPGSGKTEVVGLKAAWEINQWKSNYSGIAFLTFTNNATAIIKDRVVQFAGSSAAGYPHYIGTIDSWLHRYLAHPFGHRITDYPGEDGDHSIRIIDSTSKADFLDEYHTHYQYIRTGNVLAQEYFYDLWEDRFVFSSGSRAADNQRNAIQLVDWQLRDLWQTKRAFLRGGYATYQDIEWLSYRLLENPGIMNLISGRFPHIVIDECQDLSGNQLKIFDLLIQVGVSIHFVGDLDQSIYSFKGVFPENIQAFADQHAFSLLELTENFRSLQSIVDLCDNLVGRDGTVGRDQGDNGSPVNLYTVYADEADMGNLPARFDELLDEKHIASGRSAILARNYTGISKIRALGNPGTRHISFSPALAIKMWDVESKSKEQIEETLETLGNFLSEKVFADFSHNAQQYYCPEFVLSKITWRLFLADILTRCCQHPDLSNLQLTWSVWARNFRENFLQIIEESARVYGITLPEGILLNYRAPNNQGRNIVSDILAFPDQQAENQLRITTIHKVKGETLDAALVVSSPTNKGGGYWLRWLANPEVEEARFAYVASSRPRHLLVWALPEQSINDERRERLEELGFSLLEDYI